MKYIHLIIIIVTHISCYSQKTGKGNSSFIPDITNSTKLLKSQLSLNGFEKILPEYIQSDSSANHQYNKYTNKWDSVSAITYKYKFEYAKLYKVSVEVETNLKNKITGLTFWFDPMPMFFNKQKQLTENGYYFNEYSSEIGTKLNSGSPLKYYDAVNTCVVLDKHKEKFQIFKTKK